MRKPMWGLWLLMIVAPIAIFFGVSYKNSKVVVPVIQQHERRSSIGTNSRTEISSIDSDTDVNSGWTALKYTVSNHSLSPLVIDVRVVSGDSEISILLTKEQNLQNGSFIRATIPPTACHIVTVCYTRKNIQVPVELHTIWRDNEGRSRYGKTIYYPANYPLGTQ